MFGEPEAEPQAPLVFPSEVIGHACAEFRAPATETLVHCPRQNPWLEMVEQLAKSPLVGEAVRIYQAKWLMFGLNRLIGRGYRLVADPGINQRDMWLEKRLDMSLVRRFADIAVLFEGSPAPDAVQRAITETQRFANEYGPLGYGAFLRPREFESTHPLIEHFEWGYAEPLAYWFCEALTMKAALDLAEAIPLGTAGASTINQVVLGRQLDDYRMEAKFHVMDQERLEIMLEEIGLPSPFPDQLALDHAWKRLNATPVFDKQAPPKEMLSEEEVAFRKSRQAVVDQAEAELSGILDFKLSYHVAVRSINVRRDAHAMLPTCLLGALYLTLAQHLAETRKPAAVCGSCGKPLFGRNRVRQMNYCNSSCRMKATRARRAKL